MSTTKSKGISDQSFGVWLRHEFGRAGRLSLLLLVIGWAVVAGITAARPAFSAAWSRFNYDLSSVALDQHPLALARTFASRLRDSEYGWGPLTLATPFNVTAARAQLRHDYPEVASVAAGVPQVPRGTRLKNADPALYAQRMADYLQRYHQIEFRRFASLYDRDDLFSPPNANVKLGLLATKIFGLPDAFLFTVRSVFAGGLASVVLFSLVMLLSAVALWQSRRPARDWLKLLAWPTLASTLVWFAILFMALAAALFGGLSANTSALTLLATGPLLFVLSRMPLHLAESLILKNDKPAKWDGVERREPRPPPAGAGPTTSTSSAESRPTPPKTD